MAPFTCGQYAAFVAGIIKAANFSGRKAPYEVPFSLPVLPFQNTPPQTPYNTRRMLLLERLIDRMIKDEFLVPVPKASNAAPTEYLLHPNCKTANFEKATSSLWVRQFFYKFDFDQATSDSMAFVERFLNREAVSEVISKVKIEPELESVIHSGPSTPLRTGGNPPRAMSLSSDNSSVSDSSSPVTKFTPNSSPPSVHADETAPRKDSSRALPATLVLPSWLTDGLADFARMYPDDHLEILGVHGGVASIKCHDCPDQPFKIGLRLNNLNSLRSHSLGVKHIAAVHERIALEERKPTYTKFAEDRILKLNNQANGWNLYDKLFDLEFNGKPSITSRANVPKSAPSMQPQDTFSATSPNQRSPAHKEHVFSTAQASKPAVSKNSSNQSPSKRKLSFGEWYRSYQAALAPDYGPLSRPPPTPWPSASHGPSAAETIEAGETIIEPEAEHRSKMQRVESSTQPSESEVMSKTSTERTSNGPDISKELFARISKVEKDMQAHEGEAETAKMQDNAIRIRLSKVEKEVQTQKNEADMVKELEKPIHRRVLKLETDMKSMENQTETIKKHEATLQETSRMLGDIFDTHDAQNQAIERMRTDTTEWIKELEKENKKQKDIIQNLKGEVRRQKQSQDELVRSFELRFQQMAKENEEHLAMVNQLIKNGVNGSVAAASRPQGSSQVANSGVAGASRRTR
ncbi:hypothetical protein G7Y89_g10033 [Cudoniella acicularis]|uniref:Uncharacterized protein n=1 Tax=Cudoniella acicularis TaxID=354080 RepID=A0A8H4REK0_9HELO|nr:hypothetical protein G7Y89_g10033 [Cudoniella acicularis]